jgi:hypothetical protein
MHGANSIKNKIIIIIIIIIIKLYFTPSTQL